MSNRFHILPHEFFALPLWGRPRRLAEAEAYLDLRAHCAFHDTIVCVGRKKLALRPGEQIASLQGLADRWRWNRRTVRDFLNDLALQGLLQVTCNGKVIVLRLSIEKTIYLISPEDAAANGPPLPPDSNEVEETDRADPCNQSKINLRINSKKLISDSILDSPPESEPESPVCKPSGGESKTDSKTDLILKNDQTKTKPEAKVVTSEDLIGPWVPPPAAQFPSEYPVHEFAEHLRARLIGKGHIRYHGNMLAALRREFEQQWVAEHPEEAARLGVVDGGTPAQTAAAAPGAREQAA